MNSLDSLNVASFNGSKRESQLYFNIPVIKL